MRVLQIFLAWLWRAIWAAGVLVMTVTPKELERVLASAPNRIAAYLEWIGLEEWAASAPIQADTWLTVALVVVAALYAGNFAWKRWLRRDPDAEAMRQNPGNGWRVSRLIMRVRSMREVEELCQDFMAQPHKTDEARVLSARALRQHREEGGTQRGSWEFWSGLEDAMRRYGSDLITSTVTALDKEFPPSWPVRCCMKYRQWREKKSKGKPGESHEVGVDSASFHFDIPEPSVTLTPPSWTKPILRIRSEWKRRKQEGS